MKMKNLLLAFTLLFFLCSASCKKDETSSTPTDNPTPNNTDTPYTKTVTFKSLDDLEMTADIYHIGNDKPVMVLCHQAGWSRGEYQESAVEFNKLGFNCVAIDQRSGNGINGVPNETAKNYSPVGLPQDYINSEQDIIAAVDYTHNMYNKNVILIGSSYSSGLVLKVAKENSKVEMVLSFSPNEYYGQSFDLRGKITGLDKPTFITSSKNEAADAKLLFDVVTATKKTQFVPQGNGHHGSRALWSTNAGNEEYWTAVKDFLGK
jgi:pimeloyl-ACP methyl ester carboxylesterase